MRSKLPGIARDWIFALLLLSAGCASMPPEALNASNDPAPNAPNAPSNLPFNPWSDVREPARVESGSATAIGSHSAGCLLGAVALRPEGPGFQLMRITRRRFYGHPALIGTVEKLGLAVRAKKLGTLLIGDASQPRGGPFLTGHRSHQTGLDVDIWFWDSAEARARSLDLDERESLSARSMVSAERSGVDVAAWSNRQVEVLRLAASLEEVDRIFVNPVIKRELCARNPRDEDAAFLRKLRPWWGHDAHFHVRLKCPAGSSLCNTGKQDPLPPGSGCDSSLAWWFTEEAKVAPEKPPGEFRLPELPPECGELLSRRGGSE
ncbi:MAG: penicillin-insensitive murein endopeptidase [Oligoflexia bacterium]|nr:penicillin-insensitive murein endopeptidase [Oligoflexia bacterium]